MNIKIINKYTKLPKPLKATIAFVVANTITQGLNLLATPIFMKFMTSEEIGVVINFNSWMTLLGIIINMVLYSSSYMIAMNDFSNERYEYTSCALFISICSALIFLIICYFFSTSIQSITHMNKNLILLMCVCFLFLPATNFWYGMQRYEYHYIKVLLLGIFTGFISVTLSIFSVIYAKLYNFNTGEARIFGMNIINILIGIYFSYQIFRKGKMVWSKRFYKFILIVNTPMIFHALSKCILDISDRLMISSYIGIKEAGIYGTVYSISTVIMIIWSAVNIAIIPYLFSKMNVINENLQLLQKSVKSILLVCCLLSIILNFILPELVVIFTASEYENAIDIIPLIVSSCFITCIYSMLGNILLYNKKTYSIMIATGFGAIVNIFLNWVLIPKFGYKVASYTTLISYIILTLLLYYAILKIKNKTSKIFNGMFICRIIVLNILINMIIVYLYSYKIIYYSILLILFLVLVLKGKKIYFELIKLKDNGSQ